MLENEVVIRDGGEETLRCSDCNRPIMHYRIYAFSKDLEEKIRAKCPFCEEGQSFVVEIHGAFVYGPIGKDEDHSQTVITNIESADGITTFFTEKR